MKYSSVTNILSKEYLLIRHTTADLTCSFFMSTLWCIINGEGGVVKINGGLVRISKSPLVSVIDEKRDRMFNIDTQS